MGIELQISKVSQLLEKLLASISHPSKTTAKPDFTADSPTVKIMQEFIEGIKSLRWLNSEIRKNQFPHYMKSKDVKAITGLSSSTLWRMEKAGQFPVRRRIGNNSTRWLSTEIQEWVLSREKVL